MTHTLKDLLDPEQAAALAEAVAKRDLPNEPALMEAMGLQDDALERFVDAVIDSVTIPEDVIPARIVCAPEPMLGEDVVEINGTHIDLRGDDPWFVTPCADCRVLIKVLIKPEGIDLSKPREARCIDCGKALVKARAAEGKAVTVVHKPRVAKHAPRTKDGIDQPVEVKHIIEKEQDMDLNQYSVAQLATLVERAQDIMRTKAEDALAENVKAVLVERAEDAATDVALLEADRATRSGLVLPAFEFKGVEVPALDLSEITDMGLVMNAKQRSPYNKALYRNGEPLVSADTATYADMAKVHERLAGLVEAPKAEAKPAKAKKAKVTKVTAAVEPGAKAKFSKAQVAALAEIRGITKAKAREILASL